MITHTIELSQRWDKDALKERRDWKLFWKGVIAPAILFVVGVFILWLSEDVLHVPKFEGSNQSIPGIVAACLMIVAVFRVPDLFKMVLRTAGNLTQLNHERFMRDVIVPELKKLPDFAGEGDLHYWFLGLTRDGRGGTSSRISDEEFMVWSAFLEADLLVIVGRPEADPQWPRRKQWLAEGAARNAAREAATADEGVSLTK